jgi:broad-specificity NMP kinase
MTATFAFYKEEHILENLEAETITTCLQQYGTQWKSHTERMKDFRWTKLITVGRELTGKTSKRWFEMVTDH